MKLSAWPNSFEVVFHIYIYILYIYIYIYIQKTEYNLDEQFI